MEGEVELVSKICMVICWRGRPDLLKRMRACTRQRERERETKHGIASGSSEQEAPSPEKEKMDFFSGKKRAKGEKRKPVSYTHLTLPTKRIV